MILSHTNKYIFIKSEKTAGTSIESALSVHCGDDDVVTPLGDFRFNRNESGEWVHKHLNAGDFQQHEAALSIRRKISESIWSNYFKFSIARNPWDRVVSDFFWQNRQQLPVISRKKFFHYLGFRHDELATTKLFFKQFVMGELWRTNDRFYIIDDKLCVDFVIRYEHLGEDLDEVCRRVGLPAITLPHLKSGMRKKNHHYSEYYDAETRDIVARKHQHDIELFGYRFETA